MNLDHLLTSIARFRRRRGKATYAPVAHNAVALSRRAPDAVLPSAATGTQGVATRRKKMQLSGQKELLVNREGAA